MENIAKDFLTMDKIYPTREVEKPIKPYIFPLGNPLNLPPSFTSSGEKFDTENYLKVTGTQGLLVLQKTKLVFEQYYNGQKKDTRHISWSVAKSFISALFGIAVQEKFIKSIEQKVEEYLPELIGSGYEGVRIKDVLQMSSGVKFNEDYSDPNSDINRWFRTFTLGESQDKFAASLHRERAPGTLLNYVSIDTHVLGMILVKTTGKSLTQYLKEKIWSQICMEANAYWITDSSGMEMALGGLNAILRDYAKLGQLYLQEGKWEGKQIIPLNWLRESITPDSAHLMPNKDLPSLGYGYQWWIPPGNEGEFMAVGVFHQMIYINPTTKTVIVKNSANPEYLNKGSVYSSNLVTLELFRRIAHL